MESKEGRQPRKRPTNQFCDIEQKLLRKSFRGVGEYQFWADAVGPQGFYNAGESPVFQWKVDSYIAKEGPALDAMNELIRKLYLDGWQATG